MGFAVGAAPAAASAAPAAAEGQAEDVPMGVAGPEASQPAATAAAEVEMEDASDRLEVKRPRLKSTIMSLDVSAFVEQGSMHEGLDQQDWCLGNIAASVAAPDDEGETSGGLLREICSTENEERVTTDLVPESVVYDSRSGLELDRDLVRRGRETELEEMRRHGVFEEVRPAVARGKIVKFKWVEDLRFKDGAPFVRSRGVAMEVNTYAREDCSAGTPPIAVVRAIVSLAATKRGRRQISLHDVHVAFFHADLDEWIVVIPPPGASRAGHVWQLRKAMYGTRKAAQAWQEYVANVFKRNGWVRIAIAAGAYYEPTMDMTSAVHGDDVITEGESEALDELDRQLSADMDVKCLGRVGPDGVEELTYLKRTVRWTGRGFAWMGDGKHIQRAVDLLGVGDSKPAGTPGSKATGKGLRDALEPLEGPEAKLFQCVAGLVNFVAVDRPDVQFSVKVILADMTRPLVISMFRLKRLVRYLHGRRELWWMYDRQDMPRAVVYETDSDWADDEVTRKSTSSVFGFFGSHLLETQVASQPVVALSSGEAEFYAIGRGAASAIMMRQFFAQCGIEVRSRVSSDSSAGRAIASRIGSGKVRHLQIRDLWVQERVREGDLLLDRVSTLENRSDLGTKYLDRSRMDLLMSMSGLRPTTKGPAAGVNE